MIILQYPNKIKKEYKATINYANRGMNLEEMLNQSNTFYLDIDKAVIYKKPTPITISEVKYGEKERVITKAYFRTPSTLDYNGIYRGKYIDFDAKETKSRTSFPLANIHHHQLEHIKKVIDHGGISFLIIYMNDLFFYLDGNAILEFIKTSTRKSIPYDYILEKGFIIEKKIKPRLDYLKIIDNLYFKEG